VRGRCRRDFTIVRSPGVSGAAIDEEVGELWSVELSGRPVVEGSQARLDHRVVEDATEPVFELEVVLELVLGGVVVRKDAPDPEEEVDRGAPWVAEEGVIYVERPLPPGLPDLEGGEWCKRGHAGTVDYGLLVSRSDAAGRYNAAS